MRQMSNFSRAFRVFAQSLFATLAASACLSNCCVADDNDWKLVDVEGTTHQPAEVADGKGFVVIFVTTDCPIANSYLPKIQRLATAVSGDQVPIFLVHGDADTTVQQARDHASEYQISVPVVVDPKQTLARRVEAKMTPEAFLINQDGRILYRGRIDDRYADYGKKRPEVTSDDLKNAIDAVVAGQPIEVKRTEAIGCHIFFEDR